MRHKKNSCGEHFLLIIFRNTYFLKLCKIVVIHSSAHFHPHIKVATKTNEKQTQLDAYLKAKNIYIASRLNSKLKPMQHAKSNLLETIPNHYLKLLDTKVILLDSMLVVTDFEKQTERN